MALYSADSNKIIKGSKHQNSTECLEATGDRLISNYGQYFFSLYTIK